MTDVLSTEVAGWSRRRRLWLLVGALALLGIGAVTVRLGMRVYRMYYCLPVSAPRLYAEVSEVSGERLTRYYFHSGGAIATAVEQGGYAVPPFDAAGIAITDYRGKTGRQYNPCTVALYAIGIWERFLASGDPEHKALFLRQVDWLAATQREGRHIYDFDLKARGVSAPWISGLTQGMAVSVFLRAWQVTGEAKYRVAAEKAFEVLEVPLEAGGVACRTERGLFFEEFPCAPPASHVLNGHIFSLFGIWDLWRVTKNPDALRLFKDGVNAIRDDLDRYDTGSWVLYDQGLRPTLLNGMYMNLQIEQLRALQAITQDKVFGERAEKWERYYHSRGNFAGLFLYRCREWIRVRLFREGEEGRPAGGT